MMKLDIFLLSARLDPFPNVAIDAMRRGMPLVCFEGASGVAEVLAQQPGCRELVVPYAAIDLAAALILELGENPAYRRQMSASVKAFAARAFDMDTYTDRLDQFSRSAVAIKHQQSKALPRSATTPGSMPGSSAMRTARPYRGMWP